MKVRLKSKSKMAFVRYHYFALLTCSIFLYFISNQFFYQNESSPNSLPIVRRNRSNSSFISSSRIGTNDSIDRILISTKQLIRLKLADLNEKAGNSLLNNNNHHHLDDLKHKNNKSKKYHEKSTSKEGAKWDSNPKSNSLEKSNMNIKNMSIVSVSHSSSIVNKMTILKSKGQNHHHHFQGSSGKKFGKSVISSPSSTSSSSTSTSTSSPLPKSSSSSVSPAKLDKRQSTTVSQLNTLPIPTAPADAGTDWFQLFKETAKKVYQQLFSPEESLPEFRKWAVEKERSLLAQEMKDYTFSPAHKTLDDLVMEKGGQPIRNLIFTTWRSGSTFLGEILDSHPGTFYHYEPLLHFGLVQVRDGPLATEGIRVVRDLLNCNYNNLTDYMKFGETQHWLWNHNSRVWNFCSKNHEVCWDPKFLGDMCKMFPFQALKTVRMRLKLARSLLKDPKLNVRLLHLVRDPRGTIQSRFHRDWCPGHEDCEDPKMLCSDLVQDYHEAKKLRAEYPDRFMVVRYEDISLNVETAVKKIFKFFRLEFHPKVKSFLDAHTILNYGGVSSTYRDSKTAPFHWMQDLASNFTTIVKIQKSCKKALEVWGYNNVRSQQQLKGFKSVKEPPWPDMIISKPK